MRPWLTGIDCLYAGPPQPYHLDPDLWRRVFVVLNGKPIKDVVYAHVRQGWVTRDVRDANGRLVLDRRSDRIKTETLCGRVQLVDPTMFTLAEIYLR